MRFFDFLFGFQGGRWKLIVFIPVFAFLITFHKMPIFKKKEKKRINMPKFKELLNLLHGNEQDINCIAILVVLNSDDLS